MPTQNEVLSTEELQEMTDRISGLVERSQKVWAESLDRSVEDIATANPDPLNALPRYPFGQLELWDGIGVLTAVIGVMAVPEMS